MANKANLVDQIKGIQRSDANAKQAWWEFCDTNLAGVKDPNRHDEHILQQFMDAYASGSLVATGVPAQPRQGKSGGKGTKDAGYGGGYGGQQQSWGGKGGCVAPMGGNAGMGGMMQQMMGAMMGNMGGGGGGGLTDFIKVGQRASPTWKTCWRNYCQVYGNGMFDPSKYDEKFISQFLEYIGDLANTDLTSQAMTQGITLDDGSSDRGQKRSFAGDYGAANKRPAWAAQVADASADPAKTELVDKIKALQRADPEAKQAWWKFCDEALGGMKDPNRHDANTLQQFMSSYAC